jgi:N-hydroxyarylamine O-acetyltransferase
VVDLDAYFSRIGYSGPRDATLATLARLHELHPAAIPFENLAAFVNEVPALDAASLQAKLVRGGRGGWCFEQNLLFHDVLTALGFEVKRLAARVRWNVPPNVVTARSHCLMQVTIGGERYVADVGFGGLVLTAPLRLAPGIEQSTPHEPHRILEEGGIHSMQAQVAGEWQTLYAFEMNEAQVADYEVSNWYLSNFPQSHFVAIVVAARSMPGLRHALRGNRYSVHHVGGNTERRFLMGVKEFLEVLEGPFGIRVPRSAKLEEKLAHLIETSPPVGL